MKPIVYVLALALALSGITLIGFLLIAAILENYAVYVGIPPFGTWTHPLAWLAPLVRLIGEIISILIFISIILLKCLRGKI
mgnify:CR=1 FL=1